MKNNMIIKSLIMILIFFINGLPAYAIGTEMCDNQTVTYRCCFNDTTKKITWSTNCKDGYNGDSYVYVCQLNSGNNGSPTSGCTGG